MNGIQQPIGPPVINTIILIYALALVFLFPFREVTQPPGTLQTVWQVLLPGTAPDWKLLGGLALVAWSYFVVQDFLILRLGTPYFLAAISFPNLQRAYGVPVPSDTRELFTMFLRPSWVWVYLAPAVLFTVNLFVVLRARRRA